MKLKLEIEERLRRSLEIPREELISLEEMRKRTQSGLVPHERGQAWRKSKGLD